MEHARAASMDIGVYVIPQSWLVCMFFRVYVAEAGADVAVIVDGSAYDIMYHFRSAGE